MSTARIFLVDDDESLRRVTSYHLEQAGFAVTPLASAEEALKALEAAEHRLPSSAFPQILITDVRMPGIDGLSFLRQLKERWPQLGVIVITAHGSVEDAVEAMRAGAHDYLLKPFEHETLRLSVDKSLRLSELLRENRRLRELAGDRLRMENMVASSDAMDEVLRLAAQVAPRTTTVLLLGESGTGKEVMARAIHHASARREGPFVAVGAGSLPESLLDSELFGYRKGAFTGA
ncbi:MAG TPA: response regulator, partial [Candidatus Krumholzibacteria bacterium]|nr:response regulator [Candidatus Krumholzibacteria bacterium]